MAAVVKHRKPKPVRRPVTRSIRELTGRNAYAYQGSVYRATVAPLTVDRTIPDYVFFDRLRRGKAAGYTLGGLFCKRIEHIFSTWVLGGGVEVNLRTEEPNPAFDYTDAAIAEFLASLLDAGEDNQDEDTDQDVQTSLLMGVYEDAMGLGDQYIFVNPDGTLSIPSPDTVTCEHDPLDYRKLIKVTITTILEEYTITDEYRADGRTVTVKQGIRVISVQQYENLIGRIPMVHIANEMSGNETYGHPIHEDLLPIFSEYNDVICKQLDGAKIMGNPTPVFSGLKDVAKTKRDNMPATEDVYSDKDGNYATLPQFQMPMNAALFVGEGGNFAYASPATGFTTDTQQALDTLFLLLQYRTGIPKFAWGDELTSSRSTAEVQNSQFIKDIQGRQRDNGGWIVRLVKIWLQLRALVDPQIIVGNLSLRWPELEEDGSDIHLKKIELGRKEGLLTDETMLTLLELVDDPATEAEEARKQFDDRQAAMFPDGTSAGFQGQLTDNAAVQQMDEPPLIEPTTYYIIDAVRELRDALLEDA